MLNRQAAESEPEAKRPEEEVGATLREAIDALDAELHDDVILACERALRADPSCAEAVFLLGLVSFELEEPTQAIQILEKAHQLDPQRLEYVEALAALLARLGKVGEALFYAKLATTLAPHPTLPGLLPERFGSFFRNLETGDTSLFLIRAERKFESGQSRDAAEHCRRQLELTPGDTNALRLLARASLAEGKTETAISAYHAVLHAGEPDASDLSGMAQVLRSSGRPTEAEACQRAAEELAPNDPALGSRRLARMALDPDSSAETMAAVHATWYRRHAAPLSTHAHAVPRRPDPERPLRVAYLSGAFHRCDFADLFIPVLQGHQPTAIEAYCYSAETHIDAVTETLMQAAAKWTDITRVDDETVWEILRGDAIDIAVDLSGHFRGGRPLVFARRPAPVTLAWLGYPYPPGVPALDHVLTDAVACPDGAPAPATGEGIWRLSRAPFAFRPPMHMPEVGELPAMRAGHITFGASCDLATITPGRAGLWAGILWKIPGARLLVCNRFNQDEPCIERIGDLFSHFGLRDRVDVVNMADNFRSDFDFYHHVDLALDSGTIAALAENCRALWMGVPVLSLAGAHQGVRQGASLLNAAGRPEWTAETAEGLADVAGTLTADLGRLAALRADLRAEVAASALGDVDGLVREMKQTYREMWRAWCEFKQ